MANFAEVANPCTFRGSPPWLQNPRNIGLHDLASTVSAGDAIFEVAVEMAPCRGGSWERSTSVDGVLYGAVDRARRINGLWASYERRATPGSTCGAPWTRWTPTPTRSLEAISQDVLAADADRSG